jgi:hypothetical protein
VLPLLAIGLGVGMLYSARQRRDEISLPPGRDQQDMH